MRVALYMGAWIETRENALTEYNRQSHSIWVRGLKQWQSDILQQQLKVALYMGAWIETCGPAYSRSQRTSHSIWVRGLKPYNLNVMIPSRTSHSIWVRGLKLTILAKVGK